MSNTQPSLFPACFTVSRQIPGGETLTLKWLVNPLQRTVSGTGHITQSINPPTAITVEMTGHYTEASNGDLRVVAAGARPGAAIQVVLDLESWGGSGKALNLNWLANNHYFTDTDVPVKSTPCFD